LIMEHYFPFHKLVEYQNIIDATLITFGMITTVVAAIILFDWLEKLQK